MTRDAVVVVTSLSAPKNVVTPRRRLSALNIVIVGVVVGVVVAVVVGVAVAVVVTS
jgi:hypothetical protein